PVGIESAPDYLPDLGRLDGHHWHVCSSTKNDASGTGHSFVTLWVGARATGRPLDTDTALLVRTPSGQVYVAWNNRRLKVPTAATLGALGYAAVPQYPVGYAWLNALPAGADLSPPDVPDRGRTGPTIGAVRTVVGQVVRVDNPAMSGANEYFLVRADGLAP